MLAQDGLTFQETAIALLNRHIELVRQWNPVVGVVAKGEIDHLWERHVADSLSLAAVVNRLGRGKGTLLDIGSGGGFPAIPMKVLLPGIKLILVERSERKVGFLRKAVAALEISEVSIILGEFPRDVGRVVPDIITARAVEKPRVLAPKIAKFLSKNAVYLSQTGVSLESDFLVEKVRDSWTESGLRRGTLELIRCR